MVQADTSYANDVLEEFRKKKLQITNYELHE